MALVLTRRIGETLMIGDDVTMTVVGISGNQVRVAIDAPADVQILRDDAIQREKPSAA